jgi:hypothetical protein
MGAIERGAPVLGGQLSGGYCPGGNCPRPADGTSHVGKWVTWSICTPKQFEWQTPHLEQ